MKGINKSKTRKEIEDILEYKFKSPEILYQALTHSSYANEMYNSKNKIYKSNERLEFLGDSVLELVTSEFLYNKYKDSQEGELTKLRAGAVCESSLSSCAKDLELGEFLLLGKGEDATGGRERESILSDALEAIIGAIYLDGGFTNAKEFIHKFVLQDLNDKTLFFDSKTILQEIVQDRSKKQKIKYKLISEDGPDHNKIFTIGVYLDNELLGHGKGRTKKTAEQEAANKAIKKLEDKE